MHNLPFSATYCHSPLILFCDLNLFHYAELFRRQIYLCLCLSNNSLFEKLFGKKIKCFHCPCLSSGTAVAKHSKPYCKQRSILILSLSRCQQTRIGCFCSSFRLRLFFFPESAVKGDKRIGLEAIDKSTDCSRKSAIAMRTPIKAHDTVRKGGPSGSKLLPF